MLTFQQFLLEDRLDFLKNKYKTITAWESRHVDSIPHNVIVDFWSGVDPTPNHKYLDWILRQYLKHDFRQEDNIRVHNTLIFFNLHKAHLVQKDINKYQRLSDLEHAIEAVAGTKSKREEIKAVKHDGADKIFDEGGVVVYHIKTEAAAKFYGAGTRWCTAAEHNCQFKHYNEEGPLYVVFCKDLDGKPAKYQFHFGSDQFMDVEDNDINLKELVKKNPALRDVEDFQGQEITLTNNMNLNDKEIFIDMVYYNHYPSNIFHDPRITKKQIEWMFDGTYEDKLTQHGRSSAYRKNNDDIRVYLIKNDELIDEDVLLKALDSKDHFLKYTAINSPRTTRKVLEKASKNNDIAISSLAIRKIDRIYGPDNV